MKIKYYITIIIAIFNLTIVCGQLDSVHYFPPLKQAGNNQAIQYQRIYFSTPETTSFSVEIYKGTSTTPLTTITGLSKSAPKTYNPGNGDNDITLVSNTNTGVILSNSGLRFEALGGEKFYVNYRGRSASQAGSLTCKGQAALGTEFRWGGIPNKAVANGKLSNSLGIMATENNTQVVISGYDTNCEFRSGTDPDGITSDTITKTLNKGQTYVLEAIPSENTANNTGWIGASITANNPIAISSGGLNYGVSAGSASRDAGIDQPVPTNLLGKEYVFIRGKGTDTTEFPVIIAYQNGTDVYVGGVYFDTINDGEYVEIPGSNYSTSSPGANMFVSTSKEVYAYQCLAGQSGVQTVGMNFIAPLNCLLPSVLDEIPEIDQIAGASSGESAITIIASTVTADSSIVLTDNSGVVGLPVGSAVAGTSDWKTFYKTDLEGEVTVTSTGPIAVGTFMRYGGNAGLAGYFSGFDTAPSVDVQITGAGCFPGGTISEMTGNFDAYQWYKDGALLSGETSSTYTPTEIGNYYVDVTKGTCTYSSNIISLYYCDSEVLVTLVDSQDPILEGDSEVFTVTVKNLSVNDITSLVINTNLHVGFSIVSTSATSGSWSSSNWTIGTMTPGESQVLTINTTAIVGIEGGILNSSVSNTQDQVDSNIELDDMTEDTTVIDGEIGLEYEGVFNDDGDGVSEEGETITFTFTIHNNGEIPLSNIVLIDPFLGGTITGVYSGDLNNDSILDITEIWSITVNYPIINTDIELGYTLTSATATGVQSNNNSQTDDSDDPTDLTNIDDNSDGEPDDDTRVTLNRSTTIDFDGVDDYIQTTSVLSNVTSSSQMAWINLNSSFSTTGVILGESNNKLYVNPDNTIGASVVTSIGSYSVSTTESITDAVWTHVASIYNGNTLKIYINGEEKGSVNVTESQLGTSSSSFVIGKNPENNTQYIRSFIQEVRVYDIALTKEQLQEQIYQSINENGGNIQGSIIPKDISGLSWSNLKLYLKLTDADIGTTPDEASYTHSGTLYNITTSQATTAPMPYVALDDGDWTSLGIWQYSSVWDTTNLPNKDWAIVQITNNAKVTTTASHTHLGLLVDSGSELEIQNDQLLQNTSYLKLDGQIDLVGESQLIQTINSDLDVASTGYLERDQQGHSSIYNYNFWSSPVNPVNTLANNTDYSVAEILKDGTTATSPQTITFNTTGYNGASGAPITLADYWMFKYVNQPDLYDNWMNGHVRSTGAIKVGEGYTQKGSGAATATQNYVFTGKPNNGTIQHTIDANNVYLVGNPYASALDADQFINDNLASVENTGDVIGTGASTGALYFWEHFSTNNSHVFTEYEGGYATYNLAGGVIAVPDVDVSSNGTGSIRPGRYIPVGQGFFVQGSPSGGTIEFNNGQRAYKRESVLADDSVFTRATTETTSSDANTSDIQRMYFKFTTPEGPQRELLLAVKEGLADGMNYGYDAILIDNKATDCAWVLKEEIEQTDKKLVIQGIGAIYDDLELPLHIKVGADGVCMFEALSLVGLDPSLDVYFLDKELNSSTYLEAGMPMEFYLASGEYNDRFYIIFKASEVLDVEDIVISSEVLTVFYNTDTQSIIINNPTTFSIRNISLYNVLGKQILKEHKNYNGVTEVSVPIQVATGVYLVTFDYNDGTTVVKKLLVK